MCIPSYEGITTLLYFRNGIFGRQNRQIPQKFQYLSSRRPDKRLRRINENLKRKSKDFYNKGLQEFGVVTCLNYGIILYNKLTIADKT